MQNEYNRPSRFKHSFVNGRTYFYCAKFVIMQITRLLNRGRPAAKTQHLGCALTLASCAGDHNI